MNLPALLHPAPAQSLSEYFDLLGQQLAECSLKVCTRDSDRPWGGFLVFPEAQASLSVCQKISFAIPFAPGAPGTVGERSGTGK